MHGLTTVSQAFCPCMHVCPCMHAYWSLYDSSPMLSTGASAAERAAEASRLLRHSTPTPSPGHMQHHGAKGSDPSSHPSGSSTSMMVHDDGSWLDAMDEMPGLNARGGSGLMAGDDVPLAEAGDDPLAVARREWSPGSA